MIKSILFFFICSYTQLQNSGKVHVLMEWAVFRDHSYSNLNRRGRMKSDLHHSTFDVVEALEIVSETFFLSIGEVSSSWFEQISQPVSHEYLGYG